MGSLKGLQILDFTMLLPGLVVEVNLPEAER